MRLTGRKAFPRQLVTRSRQIQDIALIIQTMVDFQQQLAYALNVWRQIASKLHKCLVDTKSPKLKAEISHAASTSRWGSSHSLTPVTYTQHISQN